jgi:hypothetical protein
MSAEVTMAARIPLLLLSLTAPGWLLLRACGLRRRLAGAFPVSAALVYLVALAGVLAGVRLSAVRVGLGLAAVSALLALLGRAASSPVPAATAANPTAAAESADRLSRWLLGLVMVGVGLFTWRAFAQPLTGPDTSFRWNFLALELGRTGELGFYPPVTLGDFERYFYADGFAPLVALLYWWSYAVVGTTAPYVTGFVVAGQFAALVLLVHELATQRADRAAGALAAAVTVSSGLVFWAFHVGQETGWTALGVLVPAWCWCQPGAAGDVRAMLAAACGALPALVAREYGPALAIAVILLGAGAGVPWQRLAGFALAAGLLAAPWYLHVWRRCGNPFYSLSPLGLFPTNETLTGLLESYRARFALLHQRPGILAYRAVDFAANSPLVIVALAVAAWAWRRVWPWLAAAGIFAALWFNSVGYTSGGLHIANRVLAPGLALLAIAAALAWRQAPPPASNARWPLALAIVALGWSFYVNAAPPNGPAPLAPAAWWRELTRVERAPSAGSPAMITGLPPGSRILSDNAYFHVQQRAADPARPVVPYWAREFRFLFAREIDAAAAARQLRALGVSAVLVQREGSPNWAYWKTFPFFETIVAGWPAVPNSLGLELRGVPAD